MPPRLSVIIPTFTRKDSLRRLLQQLVLQTGVSPEIIVVDQNPPGWLDDLLRSFPSVKQLLLPIPNVSDARNKGFLASSGETILFIDDDLVPESDFCSKGLSIFDAHPVIGCFSPLVYNAEGKALALSEHSRRIIAPFKEDPRILKITDTISAALFFRREYFSRTGGFDPIIFQFARATEDQELFLRMQRRGMELYYVPQVEIFHDESTPGGCELRTQDYWATREKCMKGWAFRRLVHHHPPGKLSLLDHFRLARSGYINREVLASGISEIRKQMKLLKTSVRASSGFVKGLKKPYPPVESVDHIHSS